MRGMKRLLELCAAENCESGERVEQGRIESNYVKSKRCRRMFHGHLEHCENQFRGDHQNNVQVVDEDLFTIPEGSSFINKEEERSNECQNKNQFTGTHQDMAAKTITREMKRLSEHCAAKKYQSGQSVEQGRTESNCVTSKRWRTMFHPHIAEASNRCQNVDAFEYSENQFRSSDQNTASTVNEETAPKSVTKRMRKLLERCSAENDESRERVNQGRIELCDTRITKRSNQSQNENRFTSNDQGQCSQSFGQASYQRSKQGLIVSYEDLGDNIYTCDHCNANFWAAEAIKKSSSNTSLIYTNCCKKGEIKIEQSKPTSTFLENLLNPDNDSESRLFRQNIRVYNSMFSFTSMGATIDNKINTGSGPYIFKINGQVYHLMGSILPSDGESPKCTQLYVYDTKNEISNRINAIDPNHVNQNIKLDIVKGLVKMFDETNELVKEFRTIRDKFESCSLPTLNMTMINRQPTDGK